MISEAAVADYIAFFENLTPGSLSRFEEVFAPDARFRDPFNDARGVAAVRRVFEKMFDDVDEHSFKVLDHGISGNRAYLNWEFRITPKGKTKVWTIEGMSVIVFRDDGKVEAHIDHYDAASQIYEKIPLVGTVLRGLRRRIAA
ncbi:nuclear transport factor 2 family protein [Pelagibius litoralis]|uniref:Nuclear transport factor 2 family protein n=1 Tax=Pelagibius litoralis TaxID=374515 RepID=A0A967F3A0_9PROT|nr:nuclear transport factor 2 family protein [Pelagibius litoralis]NIA72414.1 nuclear transport factor 2 family protein [Pelagibius litoralis]